MALEFRLVQKMNQQLLMTPQLQQAIKLLQYGRLEFKEAIEKELEENPVLEDVKDYSKETETENTDLQQNTDKKDWELYQERFGETPRSTTRSQKDFQDMPSIENTATCKQSLSEYLISQLRLLLLNEDEEKVCLQIILNLNNDGYLCSTYEELQSFCNVEYEDILDAIDIIKELDPAGVGARNVRECLSFQLEIMGENDSLAMNLVNKHLEKLANRQYDKIAKEENVDIKDIYIALKKIKTLTPYPGRAFLNETTTYVNPDIYVYKDNNSWKISLNDEDMPELRINPEYLHLSKNSSLITDTDGNEFLSEKIKSASWFIKSIQQRQNTIYKVSQSIIKFQKEFLENGISALKPMVLKDIANDIQMHESTVSRVTNNKYIHTPQGIFELKYFFTTGLKKEQDDVSSSYIKELIRQLISKEDEKNPISDQEISQELAKQNIKIARRTVAKYRENLGLLSSSKRKNVF